MTCQYSRVYNIIKFTIIQYLKCVEPIDIIKLILDDNGYKIVKVGSQT